MRILGLDPGSNATGFGVVERRDGGVLHVAHGVLRARRSASLPVRLDALYTAVRDVIERHEPEVAAVEEVFVAASPRAALVLGQARGVALAALAAHGVSVSEYAAARTKQAVAGNGRASKEQVQRMVQRLLRLEHRPPPDASDALAAAICHAHSERLGALGFGRRGPGRPRTRAALVRRAP